MTTVSPRQGFRLPADCAARFTAERLLAQGGYGAVLLAEQQGLGRPVVVKLLTGDAPADPEQRERFVNEARIAARLEHPHIVRVIDHGAGDIPWIAYELVEGGTLRARLDRGPLPAREALAITHQVASALEVAHAAGILHRDVKPENVLLSGTGAWKLTDFGIARWSASSVRTQAGVVLGTPAYLAPEAIRGEPVDGRADLYALGVMLFEMLAGRLPFDAQQPLLVLERHLKVQPPELREVSPEVAALVARALAKHPAERFPDARTMSAALAATSTIAEAPELRPLPPPTVATPRRRPASRAAAALTAVALCALLATARRPERPHPLPLATPSAAATPAADAAWSARVRTLTAALQPQLSHLNLEPNAFAEQVAEPALASHLQQLLDVLGDAPPMSTPIELPYVPVPLSALFWMQGDAFLAPYTQLEVRFSDVDIDRDPDNPGRELERLRLYFAHDADQAARAALQRRIPAELRACRRMYRAALVVRMPLETQVGLAERIAATLQAAAALGPATLPELQQQIIEEETGRPALWISAYLRGLDFKQLGNQPAAAAQYREAFRKIPAALESGATTLGAQSVRVISSMLSNFQAATPQHPPPQYDEAVDAAARLAAAHPELAELRSRIEAMRPVRR